MNVLWWTLLFFEIVLVRTAPSVHRNTTHHEDNSAAELSPETREAITQHLKSLTLSTIRKRLAALGESAATNATNSTDPKAGRQQTFEQVFARVVAATLDNSDDITDVNDDSGVADYLFQADIILTEAQLIDLENDKHSYRRRKRQKLAESKRWPNNTMYYFFDKTINDRKKTTIGLSIAQLSSLTCLRFEESTTENARVKFFSGDGCFSAVGMTGSVQSTSIGNGCEGIGTVSHEISHALGLWHTQSRSDRDEFVQINLQSIDPKKAQNFIKFTGDFVYTVPYEYGSFMHYGAKAFVKSGGMSIIPLDSEYLYTIGSRLISFYDVSMLNTLYGCLENCNGTTIECLHGGVVNPNNCSICICPNGYGGALCDQRPPGCGSTHTATNIWQAASVTVGNKTAPGARDDFDQCISWITSPPNTTIQIRTTYMYNPQCVYGCIYNGMEIKVKEDQIMTNPRICCPSSNNVIFESSSGLVPIVMYNRHLYSIFRFQYRFVSTVTTNNTTTTTASKTATTTPTTTSTVGTVTTTTAAKTSTASTSTTITTTTTTSPTTTTTTTTTKPSEASSTPTTTLHATTAITQITQKAVNRSEDVPRTTPSKTTKKVHLTTTMPSRCRNINTDQACEQLAKSNFCTNTEAYSIDTIKYNCAKTCKLCGKVKEPCYDNYAKCDLYVSSGLCTKDDPMAAELHCAYSCGFCEHPT